MLQEWREQSDERLPESAHEVPSMAWALLVGQGAVLHVFEEDVLHALGHNPVVEEEVGFEVVFEGAEVDVCRAAGA